MNFYNGIHDILHHKNIFILNASKNINLKYIFLWNEHDIFILMNVRKMFMKKEYKVSCAEKARKKLLK